MDPIALIATLCQLATAAQRQAERVQANKAQCLRLASRIQVVTETIKRFEAKYNNAKYLGSLTQLTEHIEKCIQFMGGYAEAKWYKKILNAGATEKGFSECNAYLNEDLIQLQLDVGVSSLTEQTESTCARDADIEYIKQQQDRIIQLCQQELMRADLQQLEQREARDILQKQITSVQQQLMQQKPKKQYPFDERFLIPYHALVFKQRIAQDASNKVYRGSLDGTPVAIKVVEGLLDEAAQQQLIREMGVMSRTRGNHIAQFYGACIDPDKACLVMEFLPNGSLAHALTTHSFEPVMTKNILLEIAHGLMSLHRQGVVHGDLKNSHILFDQEWHVKITGLGLAQIRTQSIAPAASPRAMAYIAPEILQSAVVSNAQSDIYSYGVMMIEIMARSLVERCHPAELLSRIPATCPAFYKDLITACCQVDPVLRLPLPEIIARLEQYQPEPVETDPVILYERGKCVYTDAESKKKAGNTQAARVLFGEAFQLFKAAAEKKHAKAQAKLGMCYLWGAGVDSDNLLAYQWFSQAVEQAPPTPDIEFNIGRLIEKGEAGAVPRTSAVTWYQRAARHPVSNSNERIVQEARRKCQIMGAPV